MTKDSVADVLRALATGDKNRSETARLRDVVDEVEAAIAAGANRAAVLKALNDPASLVMLPPAKQPSTTRRPWPLNSMVLDLLFSVQFGIASCS